MFDGDIETFGTGESAYLFFHERFHEISIKIVQNDCDRSQLKKKNEFAA